MLCSYTDNVLFSQFVEEAKYETKCVQLVEREFGIKYCVSKNILLCHNSVFTM
jgi:hypothetical protein